MEYSNFANVESRQLKVSNKLIELGGTTWQIRNVAATHIDHIVVRFDIPEPRFNEAKPCLNLRIGYMLALSAGALLASHLWTREIHWGTAGSMVAVAGFVLFARIEKAGETRAWESRQREHQERWDVWNYIRNNPPIIYTLTLETNAGSKPLLQSLNERHMENANNAIKKAMSADTPVSIECHIDAVNIGGRDAINNFASKVYEQSIHNS